MLIKIKDTWINRDDIKKVSPTRGGCTVFLGGGCIANFKVPIEEVMAIIEKGNNE